MVTAKPVSPYLKRLVSRELNPLLATLPPKFDTIYNYQIDAVEEIVSAFDSGYKLVALEAPTGSGKTFIAELTRRLLETRATYICHNKELQAQFARDFNYSAVLYGRTNYVPTGNLQEVTCEDCTWTADKETCLLCPVRAACPYIVAKNRAIRSPIPVLNSAYWLNETMGARSRFANTGLCILDEADTLEQVLMDQVEIYISDWKQRQYKIDPPEKMTKDYLDWAEHALARLTLAIRRLDGSSLDVKQNRELRSLLTTFNTVSIMAEDLRAEQPWVYTGGAGSTRRTGNTISFKPVKVDRFGLDRIWSRDKRFLIMAAVLPDITIQSLGWTQPYKRVMIESQFHARNRQVIVRPLATMTRKETNDGEYRKLRNAVSGLLSEQPGKVLIHSVSYNLRDQLFATVRDSGRPAFSYSNANGRRAALQAYKDSANGVLLAPGLERGVDLPGDQCRMQIILKVPFLNLGDKQISERLYHTPDGKVWYNQHVATTIVQMVGRGVRSETDWCKAYILDATFIRWYREWGHLFPVWFRRAIRIES